MAKKMSISQYNNMVRQAQNKQKLAINKYNQQVRQHNSKVKTAINKYNSEVRQYNSRVRADRQRVISQLHRLSNSTKTITYREIRSSSISLNQQYTQLENQESVLAERSFGNQFLDLSERENANSLELSNTLEGQDTNESQFDPKSLLKTEISNTLSSYSEDLEKRWKGALYSLSPENPDASRHFCTSAREVYIQILDKEAPDEFVIKGNSNCEKTDKGYPTRKAKIVYMLSKAGLNIPDAVNFVDENVDNVLKLFRTFNEGTHGSSGKFSNDKLLTIKNRVEDGIIYLTTIGSNG